MRAKRRFASFLAAICMALLLAPAVAFADTNYLAINTAKDGSNVTTYVTDANAADVLGDGTVSYDKDTNTLTLNSCNLAPSNASAPAINVFTSNQGLNLVLIGENSLSGGQCMYVNGDLDISGSGTLTATGGAYAVMATRNVTIDGVTIEASTTGSAGAGVQSHQGSVTIRKAKVGATAQGTTGIYGSKGVSIENSEVTAKSASSQAYPGISASSGDVIIKDSNVTAESANDWGIAAYNNNVTIEGSTVDATGLYEGIGGIEVRISGGNVTATATGAESNAIYGESLVSITDGATVTASAQDDGAYPAVWGGSVSINGSTVKAASGGDAGIFSQDAVTIENGSDVTASGKWPAIRGNESVAISGSKVSAESSDDVAIFSPESVKIEKSIVEAKGAAGSDGIKSNDVASIGGSWISTSGDEAFGNAIGNSVLINGAEGVVIGDAVVPGNVTIPQGTTLTVPEDTTLTVPAGVTLTNTGTVIKNGAVVVNGTVVCADSSHIGGMATCKDKAVCELCGQEYGSLDASNHSSLVKTEAKPATHLAEGNAEYWSCEDCGKLFRDESGAEETTLADVAIAKTSEHAADGTGLHSDETGHWYTCECGAILDKQAHAFEWVIDKKATTSEKGSKHEECSVCGYAKPAVEIPKADASDEGADVAKDDGGDDATALAKTGDRLGAAAAVLGTVALAAAFGLAAARRRIRLS